ncbi:MAG: glutaredoxin family protein [Gammaproteobacteria bacterium]|jgi:thioredoxin-like negative regulator of GroEL|nr:glutaredoxin family protein [Gammaproteobacteria bacterium]
MLVHLYTTLGCHLCEDALVLLIEYQQTHQGALELAEIEISDSEQLIEKYGIRIPVVQVVSSGAELGWPFNQIALSDFFNQHLT